MVDERSFIMKKVFVLSLVLLIAAVYLPQCSFAASGRTINKSFPLKMGGRLALELDTGGGIEITGWDKEEIAVAVEIGGRNADEVEVDFEPGPLALSIHSDCSRRHHVDVDAHFKIMVPKKCDVDIDSKGGRVTIDGVEGKLSGKTMGGALELARVKGVIGLETMGGSVTVEDSEADGKVSTMGGEVHIRNVKGNLKGSTMGGSVIYDNVTGRSATCEDEEMHVSTMGGDIEIGGTDGNVNAKTFGGDVDVARAKEVHVTTMGGDINVDEAPAGASVQTMGGDIAIHSAGKYIKAKTMGGDIDVDSVDGRIQATTMGGDVVVTMTGDPKQGDRGVELSSMGGDITLTVPEGLSMKFDLDIKYTKKHDRHCKIDSEFPMNVEETPKWDHNWMGQAHKHVYGTGSIGGGEHLIKISTVNGDITIKKGS
jgi:DUF4097 and DUF4098 domain-containing protein YvlB